MRLLALSIIATWIMASELSGSIHSHLNDHGLAVA